MKNNPKLHTTFWFWTSLLTPILIALDIGFVIDYLTPNITYSFHEKHLNNLIEIYRLPLGIAGLCIPFVAMVAAIHRSSQTAQQIEAQQEQNNFSNHFKHLEEFKKSFESYEMTQLFPWSSIELLHKSVYPSSINGNFNPNHEIFELTDLAKMLTEDFTPSSIDIIEQVTAFSDIACDCLDIENQQINLHKIDNILETLNHALNFSALNPSIKKLDSEEIDNIKNISDLYFNTAEAVRNPVKRLLPIIEESIKSPALVEIKNEHIRAHRFIIINTLVHLYNTSQKILEKFFIEDLTNESAANAILQLRSYIDEYHDTCHHSVRKIHNLLEELRK